MEARELVKRGIPPLNSNNFGIWAIYLVAGISRYKGAKDVLNMVIPEGEGEEAKNKRMSDFGDTNDLVYSMLMEACFKHPEAMLVAANYTGGWANELFAILKERFDRVDRQATQSLVQEFHNIILQPGENGAQFVDRVKAAVKQIGEQNMKEKPTDNAIIAVIKSAIEIKFPALYEIIDLHDINLDEVYKKVAKSATSKKKVDNSSESVAASFVNDSQSLHNDRNAFIQWTSGAEFQGKQRSQGRVLAEHIPDWKKTAEVKKRNSKRFGCWNCNADDHGAVKCPYTLSSKARRMIEEQDIVNEDLARAKREKRNGRFRDDEAYRKQGRRNESRDHEYNDDEDRDRYHTRRIQDQRPAWITQINSNVDDARSGGRTETASRRVVRHDNRFD